MQNGHLDNVTSKSTSFRSWKFFVQQWQRTLRLVQNLITPRFMVWQTVYCSEQLGRKFSRGLNSVKKFVDVSKIKILAKFPKPRIGFICNPFSSSIIKSMHAVHKKICPLGNQVRQCCTIRLSWHQRLPGRLPPTLTSMGDYTTPFHCPWSVSTTEVEFAAYFSWFYWPELCKDSIILTWGRWHGGNLARSASLRHMHHGICACAQTSLISCTEKDKWERERGKSDKRQLESILQEHAEYTD